MKVLRWCYSLLLLNISSIALADGMVVDKVYHPYVMPNEQEVEWRLLSRQNDEANFLFQRLGYGYAVTDNVAIEGYLIGQRDHGDDYGLHAYELEVRWQLVEQGQYWADWGALFELEKQHQVDNWELSSGLLFEKEIYQTSLTMNLFLIYEWGETIQEEIETEFRAQYRYRWLPQFQPSIELYMGEDFIGIGPGFMGLQRFSGLKQLKWEAGFISELGHQGKDHSFRIALEYEF
ncbi:hypothetical protein [Pseudoalteromonas tunicata]|jgi:hypothetical protein|uniref:Copper resistance protein B n=1 Tax=Pseudoalteromonas tunicata D2 TaxID=87626 RepID=A4C4K3_9GAMM|nr:hypothetical protein [Pseudoalteromonas tunicata]AXT33153.1 hypothetical protein D1819_20260 [Pseudoalteromonas tunicata]EAR30485.1 hypothetical protein PTD2_02911 [Pseudoalteromonas tunicata D2]MDP4984861.1 hypothetical protein [Pseudoalteromonas tunicata]MDP5213844.1 hypothetical protein [Pseudoalteromonas tunicata]